MPVVPHPPFRVPSRDDDVCPATPFGPGKEWKTGDELMIGVGELKDVTPGLDIFEEYEPVVHLHPGPLGFAPAGPEGL